MNQNNYTWCKFYGNFFIITEGNYGAIGADDSAFLGYYIIRFNSFTYTLKADLNIDVQVISSGKLVYEGTYSFPINKNSNYYVYPKKNLTVFLRTLINGKLT